MTRLLADPAEIDRILADGAAGRGPSPDPIMDEVKDIVGFLRVVNARACVARHPACVPGALVYCCDREIPWQHEAWLRNDACSKPGHGRKFLVVVDETAEVEGALTSMPRAASSTPAA